MLLQMNKYLKAGVVVARILIGLTFMFSGIVKAIDPLGSVYKIDDYLIAFGFDIPEIFIHLFAVCQSTFEFLLGSMLLLGIWSRSASWLSLLVMLVMTPFTLYLAIKNPVSDCGCFGDAVILTNWQTFDKNVILLLLSIFIFGERNFTYTLFGKRTRRWCCLWCIIFPVMLSIFAYRHFTLIDFRPYKIGNDLSKLTKLPPTAVTDSFDYKFIYEKDGIKKSFTAENVPQDGWTFVDRQQTLVRKGDRPVIENLQMIHPVYGDITDKVLNDTSYVFLFVSPDLSVSNVSDMDKIISLSRYAKKYGYEFYGLTASDSSVIDEWTYEYDTDFDFCSTDDRVLKTMVRANPGIIVLKNGVVIRKWSSGDLPEFGKVKMPLNASPYGYPKKLSQSRMITLLALFFVFPLIFFHLFHRVSKLRKRKDKKKADDISLTINNKQL